MQDTSQTTATLQTISRYISQTLIVINYERNQKIRLKQADAEKAFARLFPNSQSSQTNVPDEFEPSVPRIVFNAAPKELTISQVATQLKLEFPRNDKTTDDQIKILNKNVRDLFFGFDDFLGKNAIRETAIIFLLRYPSEQTNLEMHTYLYDRFFKTQPLAELAAISFVLGFKTLDSFFVNIEANVYELRGQEFNPPVLTPIAINLESVPVLEKGYGVKLDVNTRPQKQIAEFSRIMNYDELLSKTTGMLNTWVDDFMGFTK